MADEFDFDPHLGRPRARGSKQARKYLGRVLAASNLARGGARAFGVRSTGYSGSRHGRAAGIGRLLSSARRPGAYRRRVIVKASIVRLAGKGAGAAAAHLRYLQREGTTRDGQAGMLYGREAEVADGADFHARCAGDRHQFRFIVSAEDGAEYDDLRPLTRRLMEQVETDLGTKLDWVAVDHFNTGHPHTHIVVRGKDDRGADLVIARDYLTSGMRERAVELVDLDFGPRTAFEIDAGLRAEVNQERLTSIDRGLLRDMSADNVFTASARDPRVQSLRAGRLAKLAKLGLAEPLDRGRWRLADGIDETLRRLGERGDIIRTMQREIARAGIDRPVAERAILVPPDAHAGPLVGRVVARGLADEHADRHYLVVDSVDGRAYYVPLGRGKNVEPLAKGMIVQVTPLRAMVREADRTITKVAEANGGRYDIDAHLRYDPGATQDFAEGHVRRLEAMRRGRGGVERDASGIWIVAADHLDRVERWERAKLRARPVVVEILSREPVQLLVDMNALTWLDREDVGDALGAVRDAGFGREVRDAVTQRRQWLVQEELADEIAGATRYRPETRALLQRRELQRVAKLLSNELGKPFADVDVGSRVDGFVRKSVELANGRFAVVERSRDFVLVPWRPVLARQLGQPVSGIVRESGISWTIGRGRAELSL